VNPSKPDADATIADFGDQWTRFQDNSGYYGSLQLFEDIVGAVLRPADVSGKHVADIGSGTGRIVEMLLAAGAAHVDAIEPSRAHTVVRERFADRQDRVTVHQLRGEEIAGLGPFDVVCSIGVLHHIPEPLPVVKAAHAALKPNGRMVAWLYGLEGNRLYLALAQPMRGVTKRLPDPVLQLLVHTLDVPLRAYITLSRYLPLPLRAYMRGYLGKLAPDKRRLVVFDQLNPAYAKYYSRAAAVQLFEQAGFSDIAIHHRHGYSWTIAGTKRGDAGADRPSAEPVSAQLQRRDV
jgi:SAM-dependent methyltransferase